MGSDQKCWKATVAGDPNLVTEVMWFHILFIAQTSVKRCLNDFSGAAGNEG